MQSYMEKMEDNSTVEGETPHNDTENFDLIDHAARQIQKAKNRKINTKKEQQSMVKKKIGGATKNSDVGRIVSSILALYISGNQQIWIGTALFVGFIIVWFVVFIL